jgi:hypothetical protein
MDPMASKYSKAIDAWPSCPGLTSTTQETLYVRMKVFPRNGVVSYQREYRKCSAAWLYSTESGYTHRLQLTTVTQTPPTESDALSIYKSLKIIKHSGPRRTRIRTRPAPTCRLWVGARGRAAENYIALPGPLSISLFCVRCFFVTYPNYSQTSLNISLSCVS